MVKMRWVWVPLAGLLAAAGAQGASGQTSSSTHAAGSAAAKPPRAHARRSWVMGNVIESKNGALSINTEDGTMLTLRVTPSTDVAVNGKKTSSRDLKVVPGADVFAAYEGSGRQPTAMILEVDETGRGLHGVPSRAGQRTQ